MQWINLNSTECIKIFSHTLDRLVPGNRVDLPALPEKNGSQIRSDHLAR